LKKKDMDLKVGKPVTGEELVGRVKEINEILLTLKAGQSVALISPRRFGKTSLMLEVLNRLKREGFYTGHIDLFTVSTIENLAFDITGQVLRNRKLDESLNKLKKNIGEILTNMKFRKEIEGQEFILSFGKPHQDPWEQLKSSIRFIDSFAGKHKKKICFAFDEFGDIEKYDGIEIIKMFRGIIQNQQQAVFLFSGSYESVMNKLFVSSKSPFYRMVKIIQPLYIEKSLLVKFVKSKFRALGIPLSDEENVMRAVELTRGHPYYIRLYIQEYWFSYLQNGKLPQPEDIFKIMMLSENNYLEKLWDEISGKHETRIVFLKVVETGKPYTGIESRSINISRALNELIGKGILISEPHGYSVTDPLLEQFARERVLKQSK